MKTLNTYVHVSGEDGRPVQFGPGDQLPEWAIAQITNPNVWADESKRPAREPGETPFGEGPFKGRSAAQVRALADRFNLENDNKNEAIAALEAEGVDPDVDFNQEGE